MNYNGRETIARKTQLAMDRASGIMIWTILDDATDDASLLRAIHETLDEPGD